MQLKDLGEFELIAKIRENFPHPPDDLLGIGDDCAVIPQKDKSLLVTTDLLCEDIHFKRNEITPGDLGHRILAINLSDIAAMGGTPQYAFLSMALPPDLEVSWAEKFLEGFKSLCLSHSVYLLGGDTSGADKISLHATLLGEATQIKTRSTAKQGDRICVTGNLGDSGGGLYCLKKCLERCQAPFKALIEQHFRPTPQIKEGKWLSEQDGVHAMMDVSDGIASDLRRIAEASCCGFEVELEKLPLSNEFTRLCKAEHLDAADFAATSGEDYCLLVTVDPNAYDKLNGQFQSTFSRPLSAIGRIVHFDQGFNFLKNKKPVELKSKGYQHWQ